MKRYISAILIPCLLFQLCGCYSFSELNSSGNFSFSEFEDKDIKITLNNGNEIFSKAYHHTNNQYQTDYLIGEGGRYDFVYLQTESFKGKINLVEIDSQRNSRNVVYLWLKDNSKISMKDGDFLFITKEMESGIWLTNNNEILLINSADVMSIEVEEFNFLNTYLLVSGVVITCGVIFGSSGGSWDEIGKAFGSVFGGAK